MTHCTNCGAECSHEHKFCSDCGTNIFYGRKDKNKYFGENQYSRKIYRGIAWPWIITILVVAGIIGGGTFIFLDALTTGGVITGSAIGAIQPPNPKVINVNCNSYGTGFLGLDDRTRVEITVQNLGGGGNVRVVGKLDQDGTDGDLSDSKTIYLGKNQVEVVIFDFDSSSFRSKKCIGSADRTYN